MSKLVAFEAWKRCEADQVVFMQRVAEGETPKAICEAMGLPRSYVLGYVKSTPVLCAQYRSALETWVESLAHETVKIADDTEGTDEAATVAAAKLRCDTRFRLASKLYREMFGEDVKPTVSVNISLGDVGREIRELETRLGIADANGRVWVVPLPAQKAVDVVDAEPLPARDASLDAVI